MSDMMVALGDTTQDGQAFFAALIEHPCTGKCLRIPSGCFPPGDLFPHPDVSIPQVRHTSTVLGFGAQEGASLIQGVNEQSVVVGCTPLQTKLTRQVIGLSGSDLVLLALQRSSSARQAAEVLIDLIGRYPLCGDWAFLVSDPQLALLLESAGNHWVLGEIRRTRAVTGCCLFRQDWDRIAPGLADQVIELGWSSADGYKLDFAGLLSDPGEDYPDRLLRWGQATYRLEHHSGQIDLALFRHLVDQQAMALHETGSTVTARVVIQLGPQQENLPVIWYAPGSAAQGLYIPLLVHACLAEEMLDGTLQTYLERLISDRCQEESTKYDTLPGDLSELQALLDALAVDASAEGARLLRQGQTEALDRHGLSFHEYCFERIQQRLLPAQRRSRARSESAVESLGATF